MEVQAKSTKARLGKPKKYMMIQMRSGAKTSQRGQGFLQTCPKVELRSVDDLEARLKCPTPSAKRPKSKKKCRIAPMQGPVTPRKGGGAT